MDNLEGAAAAASSAPQVDVRLGPVNITYTPVHEGDPSITVCHGIRFRANVPVQVSNETFIKLALGNPWFKVEGHDQADRGTGKRTPKSAEEYRFYATEWFKKAPSYDAFIDRWKAEQELRERIGFGEDDQEWLDSLAGPILAELKKAETAQDPQ